MKKFVVPLTLIFTLVLIINSCSQTQQNPKVKKMVALKDAEGDAEYLLKKKPEKIKLPAKLGIAFLDGANGKNIIVDSKTQNEWCKELKKHSKIIGEVEFLPDVLISSGTNIKISDLRTVAGERRADLLLVVCRTSTAEDYHNTLSLLYLTVIGTFIFHGTDVKSVGVAKGCLVNVKNGYIYAINKTKGEHNTSGAIVFRNKMIKDAKEKAEANAIEKLKNSVSKELEKLYSKK